MTREEAINDLKDFIDTYITIHGEEDTIAVSLDNVDVEAFHVAIKALAQEPILDKIRAEIEQITDTMGVSYNQYVSKIDVLQIIDKYKEESEDEDDN